MATMRGRFGKLVVDFRYLGKRCREKTSLEDNPANRKKLAQVMKKNGSRNYPRYFRLCRLLSKE